MIKADITFFNHLTVAGLYIDNYSWKTLQFCVDYIYKLNLYLLNTTLIYKYNLLIILGNK